MSAMGHQRRFERLSTTSAVTPRTDIRLRRNIRRDGPQGDIFARQKSSERLHCRTLREVGHRTLI